MAERPPFRFFPLSSSLRLKLLTPGAGSGLEQGLGVANALQGSHEHPTAADKRPGIRVNTTIVPRSIWYSADA